MTTEPKPRAPRKDIGKPRPAYPKGRRSRYASIRNFRSSALIAERPTPSEPSAAREAEEARGAAQILTLAAARMLVFAEILRDAKIDSVYYLAKTRLAKQSTLLDFINNRADGGPERFGAVNKLLMQKSGRDLFDLPTEIMLTTSGQVHVMNTHRGGMQESIILDIKGSTVPALLAKSLGLYELLSRSHS